MFRLLLSGPANRPPVLKFNEHYCSSKKSHLLVRDFLVNKIMNTYVHRMSGRRYTLGKRADSQEVTRARIVEATMRLHEELGPRNTTISAVAERAGVQRLTVYRHFPDAENLFEACSSRWLEENPPPDPQLWAAVAGGFDRCRAALSALYLYFRDTRRMWAAALRDEQEVPALRAPMQIARGYLAQVRDDLLSALDAPEAARPDLAAILGHAVHFSTWASLDEQGLEPARAAALVTAWIEALAPPGGGRESAGSPNAALRKDQEGTE